LVGLLSFIFSLVKHLIENSFKGRAFWSFISYDFDVLGLVCITPFLTSS
jgi:hypothetical protein